jgi:intraflagellar transport protein 46
VGKVTTQPVVANAYNPMDYAGLKVSTEISELFQSITRYHPHNIELEAKFRPFIPEYLPAVGEVDAFLKIPRPDENEELLGLTTLVSWFEHTAG